jgi:hypothetical protein
LDIAQVDIQVDESTTTMGFFDRYRGFQPGTRVYVTLPDGTTEGFTFQVVAGTSFMGLVFDYHGYFVPDPGNTVSLSVPDVVMQNPFGTGEYLAVLSDGYMEYNPANPIFGASYTITTSGRYDYEIDPRTSETRKISDVNANFLTFTENKIEANTGEAVTFERDYAGRITGLIDPLGNKIRYEYSAVFQSTEPHIRNMRHLQTIQTREQETRKPTDLPARLLRASGKLFDNSTETSIARRSARTISARSSAHGLRRAEVHDRQMPSPTVVLDVKHEPNTRLALHGNTRHRTRRTTGPTRARLESRLTTCRMAIVVNLVRGPAVEECVWSPLVEPFHEERQLSPEVSASSGHADHASAFVFQSSDEPFDHGNAAVFSDGAESRLDALGLAAVLERRAPELATFVGHDVLGFHTVAPDRAIQEVLDGPGSRLRSVDHESHDSPRVVVDNDGYPPRKRPHLGQRKRRPRRPQAAEDGDDCEVDVPQMVRILGLHDPFGPFLVVVGRLDGGHSGGRYGLLFEHSPDGRFAEVEPGAAEGLDDFRLRARPRRDALSTMRWWRASPGSDRPSVSTKPVFLAFCT